MQSKPGSSGIFWLKEIPSPELVLLYSSLRNHTPPFRYLSPKAKDISWSQCPIFLFCKENTRTLLLVCSWMLWGHPFGKKEYYSDGSLRFRIEFFKGRILGYLILMDMLLSPLLIAPFYGTFVDFQLYQLSCQFHKINGTMSAFKSGKGDWPSPHYHTVHWGLGWTEVAAGSLRPQGGCSSSEFIR